uniref:HIVEP zinc finger 1 n=1 Tax=Takifugu rubripes TaxID=31033 RepID=A0A674N0T0_TAKRU
MCVIGEIPLNSFALFAGISESSRRNADNIKSLKRKKVVVENLLEKIPKSPVKKPQLKTSESGNQEAQSKETSQSSCSSNPNDPSHKPSTSPGETRNLQYAQTVDTSPHKEPCSTEAEGLSPEDASSGPSLVLPDGDEGPVITDKLSQDKESKSQEPRFEGDPYHSSDPLGVLLKAMEPDFSTLAERSHSLQAVGKSASTVDVRSGGELTTMSAVNVGLQNQPSHLQTYYIDKQGNFIGIAAPLQTNAQKSTQVTHLQSSPVATQHFLPVASNTEQPSQHISFNSGPATITHAPVPSGSNTLPQSQPPVVHTCQSLSASVPSTIQVPVTPGTNQVQMTTVMNFGVDQVYKDQKPKKPGKYVCEYCSRACAKPSVLLKHIRSHTGERPYPCVTCGFSFKTKSNLYKHKKSHAHAIKLGLTARSESGFGSLSQESDKAFGTHSEESGDSDEEVSNADLKTKISKASVAASPECSFQSAGTTSVIHGESESSANLDSSKPVPSQRAHEPKVTAALPKVVVYPVNVSPLRADSPRVTGTAPEQAAAQQQQELQAVSTRSSSKVLPSLKEVVGTSPSLDTVSEDEDHQCRSPMLSGHAQLQRQQATDFSQQQQAKCLLSPRSLGSTDSGYFSRSESADQAMSPSSPFVKITPPVEMDMAKSLIPNVPTVATVMHVAAEQKPCSTEGQMRPPLEAKTLSLEERISKLISDNEAVVDNKQLDSVKPRRTSLSRRGSIDSPKSYIFKDSFQFDLKPMGRRSSSSSDIPKSPFTPSDKSKPVFLLSVPPQYPPMDCLPITRSNSMPTTPGHSALPLNVAPPPHPLRICQSFDEKITSLNDDVFSSTPSTPNPAIHSRTLVRQIAVEDFSSSEGHGLPTVRSMDDGYHGPSSSTELMQRSRSFEHHQDRNRKTQQSKGTMYECETCRNRYRKLENFETHKKFYCSELHGPKNKPITAKEADQDVFHVNMIHPAIPQRSTSGLGSIDQQTSIRKRRKMKSVGDEDDQSPTDTTPPVSGSFELQTAPANPKFSHHNVIVDIQPKNNQKKLPQIQLIARGLNTSDSRLSPIRETQISTSSKGELQRQGSGTSVIRHTNSLSRPNSFEIESVDRASPVECLERDPSTALKTDVSANTSAGGYHDNISTPKGADCGKQNKEQCGTSTAAGTAAENSTPVHQSRLVRQNNIQVPEILVTEEPDREHEIQSTESVDKAADQFSWPQRSESLSKLPAEKLPPKKKRIRLAQMDHSSGESSFESSLSQSLSRDSSLSRCSSISASFEREEPSRSESPCRAEYVNKIQDPQVLPAVVNTLGVPGMMRRAASEQITCAQPSLEISCDYRSKSFDCGNVSPSRSVSSTGQPKSAQNSQFAQVPLIERRRGPLVRQMSLKIGPESQHPAGKVLQHDKPLITNVSSLTQSRVPQVHIANRHTMHQPFIPHTGESPLQKNEEMVQSINLGSATQQPQVHGLPHPWHQTSRVQICQKKPQNQTSVCQDNVQNKPINSEEKKSFEPQYQLHCPTLRANPTFSFCTTQRIALPVLTIPIATPVVSKTKSSDLLQNAYVAQPVQQVLEVKKQGAPLVGEQQRDQVDQTNAGAIQLPQILITHEQMQSAPPVHNKNGPLSTHHSESDAALSAKKDKSQAIGTRDCPVEQAASQGSSPRPQKPTSVSLCPQQEPTASSKRMLSPANSLDIYMEKHQKRAKDEHGVACLTDGRSVNYLTSKMSEVTRQRKLTLVRQVCTTEPVDSPIETEAPPLPQGKTDGEKDSEDTDDIKPMSPDSAGLGKVVSIGIPEEEGPSLSTAPRSQDSSIPSNGALKLQEKMEERKWIPAKSHFRPSAIHGGQIKLTSVSVVNTKDSHRLSFPSLKTATTYTWCFLMKRKPLHVPQTDLKTSAYAAWTVSPSNHNPLGLPTKVVMSLFDSKQSSKNTHYTSAIRTSGKSDILCYSGKLKDIMPRVPVSRKPACVETKSKAQESQSSKELDKDIAPKTEPRRIKIFDGGYKSNEEYVYVRGRGRGKYICEECGIRCKKPSMLRKHIRTHSDVRPYHCVHCNFSFKTKGNLTKHMKSKAHSKKCLEMGVPELLIEDQDAEDSEDRSHVSSADRQDSDGDDSDGPDDEDNDDNEEEEDDSQPESGLSTNPSVSASPQHLSSKEAEIPPSALLAQMSISSVSLLPVQPAVPESHPSDCISVMTSVSLSKQMCISGSFSPAPVSYCPPAVATTTEASTSDTESVHMMSPVSPCRQMSIDYPDFDVPPSPPALAKGSKQGQDPSSAPAAGATAEPGIPVDRSTQTSSYASQGPVHFPPQGVSQTLGAEPHTHLFSHLPLHSQQPSRSSYSMVPVGGIQLFPSGLAAYSTFVPIQAGPVQLTIPAVSIIHRNTSPLPTSNPSAPPEAMQTQPLVVQEPISNVVPCFPLGQVAGLQPQTIQPVGLETLNLMGLTNTGLASTQLLNQQGLTLNATLGLQVLAANPTSQSNTVPQAHVPGLQIVNIALPAIIPSLSPLPALSPLPGSSERQSSPEAAGMQPSPSERGPGSSRSCASPLLPTSVNVSSASSATSDTRGGLTQTVEREETQTSLEQRASPSKRPEDDARGAPVEGVSDPGPPRPPPVSSWQKVITDYNDVSSDDEDRLVIAT